MRDTRAATVPTGWVAHRTPPSERAAHAGDALRRAARAVAPAVKWKVGGGIFEWTVIFFFIRVRVTTKQRPCFAAMDGAAVSSTEPKNTVSHTCCTAHVFFTPRGAVCSPTAQPHVRAQNTHITALFAPPTESRKSHCPPASGPRQPLPPYIATPARPTPSCSPRRSSARMPRGC